MLPASSSLASTGSGHVVNADGEAGDDDGRRCSVAEEAAEVARVAPVAWAQRTDRLYLTLQVTECSKPSIRVEPSGRLHFQGLCGPNQLLYACDLQLYGAVDPDVRHP